MFGQETIQIAKIQSVQICKPFTYCIKNESGSWKSQARAFSPRSTSKSRQNITTNLSHWNSCQDDDGTTVWHPGHVAALVRCVLIGGEYISLIKSCHIRRRNERVRVKRHWVTEWNRKLQRKNEARGREKQIVRNREQLQSIDTPWVNTTLTERTAAHDLETRE